MSHPPKQRVIGDLMSSATSRVETASSEAHFSRTAWNDPSRENKGVTCANAADRRGAFIFFGNWQIVIEEDVIFGGL